MFFLRTSLTFSAAHASSLVVTMRFSGRVACFLALPITLVGKKFLPFGYGSSVDSCFKNENEAYQLSSLAPAPVTIPPVRGGALLWRKSPEEKAKVAKEHAKKSYFWGKEYAKDKATESKQLAAERAEAARRQATRASEQGKDSLLKAQRNLDEKSDAAKVHAHHLKEKAKEGLNATTSTLAAGKHKIEAVGNTVEVMGDVKSGYDKYLAGKAKAGELVKSAEEGLEEGAEKTKGLLHRVWSYFWWPARLTTVSKKPTITSPAGEPLVLEEKNVVTAPRSVDEALEEFEACKVSEWEEMRGPSLIVV